MFRKRDKRKSCRVHDRQIDRNVCRVTLKKQGIRKPNKALRDNWRRFAEG